ncbi:MAG: hypothetical protein LBB51_06320 [Zoogloeaceae bacterium]|nr:hypothetical protein [Zoogloeaceae bacterium]
MRKRKPAAMVSNMTDEAMLNACRNGMRFMHANQLAEAGKNLLADIEPNKPAKSRVLLSWRTLNVPENGRRSCNRPVCACFSLHLAS